MMREPSFWWNNRGPFPRLLAPLGTVYGAVASHRMKQKGREVGVPIICIGNLTTGGAGKTPTAIAIARQFRADYLFPVFLTRGFGASLKGPVLVEEQRAADIGDEPLLLAREALTIVARDRLKGAQFALASNPHVIIMDDGFQNPALAKDFSLIVVDGQRGIGNGRVFPAGPLRAPLDVQMDFADAVLIVGNLTDAVSPVLAAADKRKIPVFRGRLAPNQNAVASLKGKRILAFAGIGNPEKFFEAVRNAGLSLVSTRSYPDHHRLTASEIHELLTHAERDELTLVTTEKDLARMHGDTEAAELAKRVQIFPVELKFDDEIKIQQILSQIVQL